MSLLQGKQKVDISSFTAAERELFEKYGKVPTHKSLLGNKLKERKYFDSGDYALSKAGVSPSHAVGTAIPSPADIPHASPPSTTSQSIGILGTSPTNSTGTGMGTSPGKEGMGLSRADNRTFS